MKERCVLPKEIRKQVEAFTGLREEFSTLKRQQHIDRTAKTKLVELGKKLDSLCASVGTYFQVQATHWAERRREISKQIL